MQQPHHEELNRLEETLRKLKTQYHLFFVGVRKLPPTEDKKRLEEAFREMSSSRMRDNTARFRLSTLVARYNRYQELWTRQMREREEGPMDFRRRSAALREPYEDPAAVEPEKAPVTSAAPDPYVKVSAASENDAMTQLHRLISEENKKLGKGSPSAEQVAALVQKQTQELRARYNVDEVGFRVETVDGKVRLRAKPISNSGRQ